MTMNFAKSCAKLIGVLVISAGLGAGLWAQNKTTKKPARKRAPKAQAAGKPSPAAAPAAAPATSAPAPDASAGADKTITVEGKRDPFVSLINVSNGKGMNLPPGKAGLVIATLHVDGTVQSQGGMIAVLSNPDQRVYFVREGDKLYDGDVEKITLDGVTFQEDSKDAFGKPIERVVTKRIYASAGEQQ
jgi:hypothetical protein